MYLRTHPGHYRYRLPSQKRHLRLKNVPSPTLGHRRTGTLQKPHTQLPQGFELQSNSVRCDEPAVPEKGSGVAGSLQRAQERAGDVLPDWKQDRPRGIVAVD